MELVNGKDDVPYMKWEKTMFQTTNQWGTEETSC